MLFEEGRQTFNALHVQGAENVANAAKAHGITNFVHLSAIGADEAAASEYSRTKAAGEHSVAKAVPSADIMRPSIMFGPEDSFFNRFAALTRMTPALPLIGGGHTQIKPVYAGDVAQAIAAVLSKRTQGETYELAGPRAYSFAELMQFTLDHTHRKRLLLPLPWFAANMVGFMGELSGYLPFVKPFLTRDQVASLKTDNVPSGSMKGLADLGIQTETIEAIVPPYLERYRKYGQFYEKQA